MKPMKPMIPRTLGGLAASTLFVPCNLVAQTLTQHWKMDEPSLTYTASLAPIVNNGSLATAGALHNAGDIPNNPVAAQAGATAATGTSIRTRTRFQRIQLGNSSPTTGAFTIALWFRRDGTASGGLDQVGGDQEHILSGNQAQTGRWNLTAGTYVAATKSFDLSWFHNGGLSPIIASGLSSNTWHHLAVTREMPSGAIKFYLNGQLTASGTDTASFTNSTNGLLLGRDPGFYTTNRGFVGNFDDVRFYNGALLQSTVITSLVGDTDSDGLADIWEITNFILPGEDPVANSATILARHDGTTDADGDTLDNLGEFNALTNPNLADTDNDNLSDKVETNTGTWISASSTGTKPLKADSDGDGLLDGEENNSATYVSPTDTGTNPNLADSDADTFNDYLEIARSTNPTSGASSPGTSSATPLIDLNASLLPTGALSSWSNTGTLGRAFATDVAPVVASIGGVKGVTFSGGEVMTGPVAPSNLTGSSPRTIQAWIFNPSTSTEETIVSWGRRDGPNGTTNSFLHGTSTAFGAVGNWGTPDMSWGPDAPAITANVKLGSWTYVVYTYDGGVTNVGTVYSNGNLANTEALGLLNTWAVGNNAAARPLPIRVAGQNAANGTLSTAGQKGSLTIARLRIHDRVVPSADLGFNDTDTDGMKDWYEDFYGLNKNLDDAGVDADLDGLLNIEEQTAGTNPSVPDSDDDGLPDGWEFDNFGSQVATPLQDSDNDGSTNLEEYQTPRGLLISRDVEGNVTGRTPFTGTSNPNDANSQPDGDNDNLPDGWEYTYLNGLSAGPATDSDLDTFLNDAEFIAGSDPGEALSTPNDTDADGLLDSWEITRFGNKTSQDGTGDPDADGSTNLAEFTSNTDPNDPNSQPNTDGDNLPDGYEYIHFGDLDEVDGGDFDLDTFGNLAERTAGSNPARKANTPANVNATTRVAIAVVSGIEEYTVTNGTWTFVRQICAITGGMFGITSFNGSLYAVTQETTPRVIRVNPTSGAITELALRNAGDAATAGWINSNPQGIEPGPDGKLYFSTAFGASAGEGVFRLNPDGSGFERFITRTGGIAPDDWDLNNARDLEWDGSNLYVSARGGFNAVSRPVYKFTAAGAFAATISNSLVGPQGLEVEQGGLLVTSSAVGVNGLTLLDLAGPFPTAPVSRSVAGITGGMDVIDLNGSTNLVTFNTGTGGVGQVLRRNFNGSYSTVVAALSGTANDLAVFEAAAAGSYDAWATSFGLDPESVDGAPTGDADKDGTLNSVEFALDLDPTDGTSRFAIVTSGTAATGLTLTWPSAEGVSFQVRSSTDLSDWTALEATVIGGAGDPTASWTAPAAAGGKRFYRIEFTP